MKKVSALDRRTGEAETIYLKFGDKRLEQIAHCNAVSPDRIWNGWKPARK